MRQVLVLAIFLLCMTVLAQENRYLVLYQDFIFETRNGLPYETLRPMCWNSSGYCDTSFKDSVVIARIIDLETGELRYWQSSDAGCFTYLMRMDTPMLEPHMQAVEWVTCESGSS
jgi:hypothetical protein